MSIRNQVYSRGGREAFENIIPVGKKNFAYQCENVETVCVITGRPPFRVGSEPYVNAEKDIVSGYELRIEKHTSNALNVTLIKRRSDTIDTRRKNGAAILEEKYFFTTDFAELVNQIFRGIKCDHVQETEAFPESVRQTMRTAYDK